MCQAGCRDDDQEVADCSERARFERLEHYLFDDGLVERLARLEEKSKWTLRVAWLTFASVLASVLAFALHFQAVGS